MFSPVSVSLSCCPLNSFPDTRVPGSAGSPKKMLRLHIWTIRRKSGVDLRAQKKDINNSLFVCSFPQRLTAPRPILVIIVRLILFTELKINHYYLKKYM